MDQALKVAKHRLSVLQLAETMGNISDACRRRGMHRNQFYEFKRRFQTHGIEGLKDLPPIAKSHPMTTPPEVVEKILTMALERPSRGCNWLEAKLKQTGLSVSNVTIQHILIKHNLGTRYNRWLALESKAAKTPQKLTGEQVSYLEKLNPCYRERHVESSRPGELLSQVTFFVRVLTGVGRVYMHTVVDTYSSYAFGFLHVSKEPAAAVAVLHNNTLPFYRRLKLPVRAILTDNGREYCGTENHPYQLYLELNDIEHKRTQVRRPQTNGFVERFNRTVLDEFYRVVFRQKMYDSVEKLQKDLDAWLKTYNCERPHQGYRNQGRTPLETIKMSLEKIHKNVKKAA